MRGNDLHDAMAYLDEDLIYEAEVTKFRKSPWKSILASAAVLVLLAGTAAAFLEPTECVQPQHSAPEPPPSQTEPAPDEPAEDSLQWDSALPVKDHEFLLSNGVRLGMTFEDTVRYVRAASDADIVFDNQEYSFCFQADDVSYDFSRNGDGPRILIAVTIGPESSLRFGRDFHIGESMDEVFSKIPARDTVLKQWHIQSLYDYDPCIAYLSFRDLSYYAITIQTDSSSVTLNFTPDTMELQSMNISMRQASSAGEPEADG